MLVAHNAPFDVGFLRHFALQQGRPWPSFEVVDTARLARRVVTRDDAPNCKLSSLARVFQSGTTPNHRALSDARATVDVLHGLMERLGGLGVHTLEELQTFTSRVSPAQRRKRYLAEGLPHAPGVYLFRDEQSRVLYIGTSRDLRTRVRTYFTASETRSRMGEMVGIAATVDGIECATPLEAEVRELRLIAEHKPRYNRRSRFPEKVHFLKLTRETWPRLSLVRRVLDDEADYLGPFASRKTAEKCLAALHEAFPVRQCSDHLAQHPSRSPCVLAEMGRCLSPCDGSADITSYAAVVRSLRDSLLRDPDDVVEVLQRRMLRLSSEERFEEARVHRDRLSAFLRAAARTQRLSALTRCPEIVAARREDDGRWAVHVVRHGRLAAAGVIPPAPTPTPTSRGCAPRPRRSRPLPDRCRPPPPRSRRRCCAGSSRPVSAWSTSTGSGAARCGAPPATSRSTTPSTSPASRWCPSTSGATSRSSTAPEPASRD